MDPIQPIGPVIPGVGPVTPLPSTRRVNPDARNERNRDGRREDNPRHRRGAQPPDSDEPDTTPHIDITA